MEKRVGAGYDLQSLNMLSIPKASLSLQQFPAALSAFTMEKDGTSPLLLPVPLLLANMR